MDACFAPYRAELGRIRHIVMDMDGTIYHGNRLFSTTRPFLDRLRRLGIGFTFLTNNSSRSTDVYLERLKNFGIIVPREAMLTSTVNAIDYLHRKLPEVRRLFMLGTGSFRAEMSAAGFADCTMEEEPEAVVTAFDTALQYERLCKTAWWIKHGKPWIATHCDLECPTELPTTLVDCGSITACLTAATGGKKPVVLGKPGRVMMETVFVRHGLAPEEVIMCGDRPYTDIQLAVNSGVRSVRVISPEMEETGVQDSVPEDAPVPQATWTVPHLEILGEALEESLILK